MLPSEFGNNYTPATVYFGDAVVAFIVVVVAVSLCLGVSGQGLLERSRGCGILLITWGIGGAIIALQVSHHWEQAEVSTKISMPSPGKPNILQERPATLKLLIGLRGINVTFEAHDHGDEPKRNSFHFNEQFTWAWSQGREGFGPFAGPFQQEFRRGQRLGFPVPVLRVADLFVHDGEGVRWGRMYRIAGWHAHLLIWVALASWIVFIICLQAALVPAGKMIGLTGILLCCAAGVWAGLSPSQAVHYPTVIIGDLVLVPKLGAAFYICVITGILCLIMAAFLLVADAYFPIAAANWFGLDPLISYDEHYCSPEQAEQVKTEAFAPTFPGILLRRSPRSSLNGAYEHLEMDNLIDAVIDVDPVVQPHDPQNRKTQVLVLRRRGTFFRNPKTPRSPVHQIEEPQTRNKTLETEGKSEQISGATSHSPGISSPGLSQDK